MLASEMVTAVKNQGGFDTSGANVTDATILSWLNAKYYELCARTKFTKALVEIGPTVLGNPDYTLLTTITELTKLRVGTSKPALRVSLDEMWELQGGTSFLPAGKTHAYAPSFEPVGGDLGQRVTIYPTPTSSGEEITALAVVLPSPITTSPDSTPLVPVDFHEAIVAGALAVGLERTDGRFDVSAGFNAQFESAVALLKRRAVTRVGQGATQFKVAGVHF